MTSHTSLNEYVAIDVETTGLNPQNDEVIEVAIIVYNEHVEISLYSQMIRPKRPIPMQISLR